MYYAREDVWLTGIHVQLRRDRHSKLFTLRATAVVCLVLLVLLAVAQVTHVHAAGSDTDHCPLCIAMHSVVPFVIMVATVVLVRIGTAALVLLETRTVIRYWHPNLFTRPPPACS